MVAGELCLRGWSLRNYTGVQRITVQFVLGEQVLRVFNTDTPVSFSVKPLSLLVMLHIIFSLELKYMCPALPERIFVRVLISAPVSSVPFP